MSLLEVKNLSIAYAGCEPAVQELSFSVEAGASVGIVGESGAGKSQTALALMGLLPRNAMAGGSIRIGGTEVVGANVKTLRALRTRRISMVFQDPLAAFNPYLRIGEQLRLIVDQHEIGKRRERRRRCLEMLERVGLRDPERQYRSYPHQLSGGMRQRALIAAALIGEASLLVADEPTTALDVTVQAQILELLGRLRADLGTAILLITHDLGVIANTCEHLIVMDKGRLVEQGDCRDLLSNPQEAHTARLVAAVPDLAIAPQHRAKRPAGDPILRVDGLSVHFGRRRREPKPALPAVDSVDFEVENGETLAIVGESGSGKTSIARCIAGLLPGHGGSVHFEGGPLPRRVSKRPVPLRRKLQMVFQDPAASLNPAMTVSRIIAEPLGVHQRGLGSAAVREKVTDMMTRVGLSASLGRRLPHELSGGQAQRVAIARALIIEPAVLMCDEAMAALDGTVRREIIDLLEAEKERLQMTLIVITHDLGVVHEMADRVAVMYQGRICELASCEDIFQHPQHEYTKSLLMAVPAISR